ncbi:neuropeptide-like precursor 1 [Battus philenor]|uniref:neuropeptide-like precursor 1 n=1 Tax=Battus philenor TaxID=42288 RepID=UPI0035CEE515
MRRLIRTSNRKHRPLLIITLVLALSTYFDQALSLPTDTSDQWPSFPRRNIAALAREGYLKTISPGFKRSISTLAKNGQLPTFRSPYNEADKPEQEDESSPDKRNIASIARLRSYTTIKRNIQSLARDGYRVGRGQYQPNDKRNIASLARNGMIHKRDEIIGDEYYPIYQNSLVPMSEIDSPYDINDIYDYDQSVNPNALPPFSQIFKRSVVGPLAYPDNSNEADYDRNWYLKRGTIGMPVHGLYRPIYIDPTTRTKRYILSMPDVINNNDIEATENDDNNNENKRSVDEDVGRDNFAKRHIGSLARLGLLPSFRFSGGRYSRSGRARLLLPSQELYRKHSSDENFGIRQYISSPEVDAAIDSDDTDLPPPPVLAHSHPTGRYLHRSLNDLSLSQNTLPQNPSNSVDSYSKTSWPTNSKDYPRFHYFRSLKVPYHSSGKRYLLLPAVDNIMLRKTYRNSSLPSRRKNQ